MAVAVYAALSRAADAARPAGDPRTRTQLMADIFTERLLGCPADQLASEIELIMTDQALLTPHRDAATDEPADKPADGPGEADVPAWLVGYGTAP